MYKKKYLKYKSKYVRAKQLMAGGFGGDIYYQRPDNDNTKNYDYGADFVLAKLYINAKDEGSFPIMRRVKDSNFFEYDNLKKYSHYQDVVKNRYNSLYAKLNPIDANLLTNDLDKEISQLTHGEKLLMVMLMAIYHLFEYLIKDPIIPYCGYECMINWTNFDKIIGNNTGTNIQDEKKQVQSKIYSGVSEFIGKYVKNNNIGRFEITKYYISNIVKNNVIDMTIFTNMIRFLTILGYRGDDISDHSTPRSDGVIMIEEEIDELPINKLYDMAFAYKIHSKLSSRKKDIIEDKIVCMFTRTGAYGINTLLLLFFNKLFPVGTSFNINCTEDEICVHAQSQVGSINLMMHDLSHVSRLTLSTENELYFAYLKLCYMIIINQWAGSYDLLLYLFVITNEMSLYLRLMERPIQDFSVMIKEFFRVAEGFSGFTRIEHDYSFMKMLDAFKCANVGDYISEGVDLVKNPTVGQENDFYLQHCMDNLHGKFNKFFHIVDALSVTPQTRQLMVQKVATKEQIVTEMNDNIKRVFVQIFKDYVPVEQKSTFMEEFKDQSALFKLDLSQLNSSPPIYLQQLPEKSSDLKASYSYLLEDHRDVLKKYNFDNWDKIPLPAWTRQDMLSRMQFGEKGANNVINYEKENGFFLWSPLFSNVHNTYAYIEPKILFNNEWYRGPEQAYQAAKSLGTPSHKEAVNQIKNATEIDAVNLGYRFELNPDWDNSKYSIMKEIMRAKFSNKFLNDLLLSTKNYKLVNFNPGDEYWGTGASGKGKNFLGKILMEIRDEKI